MKSFWDGNNDNCDANKNDHDDDGDGSGYGGASVEHCTDRVFS